MATPHSTAPIVPIAIERATADDVEAIRLTAAESWRAAYGDFLTAKEIDDFLARWYSADNVRRSVERSETIFLVAREGDQVIGFLQAGLSPRGGELYRIYLRPAFWGKRIGDRLLAQGEAWLREQGCAGYGLFVLSENLIGRRFYERQGFLSKPELNTKEELYLWKAL